MSVAVYDSPNMSVHVISKCPDNGRLDQTYGGRGAIIAKIVDTGFGITISKVGDDTRLSSLIVQMIMNAPAVSVTSSNMKLQMVVVTVIVDPKVLK